MSGAGMDAVVDPVGEERDDAVGDVVEGYEFVGAEFVGLQLDGGELLFGEVSAVVDEDEAFAAVRPVRGPVDGEEPARRQVETELLFDFAVGAGAGGDSSVSTAPPGMSQGSL